MAKLVSQGSGTVMADMFRPRAALAVAALVAAAGVAYAGGAAHAALAAGRRPAAGIISTVAGGDGGPGRGVGVAVQPCGLKFVRGDLYIGGGGMVRRVDPRTGWLTTPVADRSGVCAVTVDVAGNVLEGTGPEVWVAAKRTGLFYGQRMTAGHSYRIAGFSDRAGNQTGDGGPALYGNLSAAADVELDHAGNVVVADAGTAPDYRGVPLLGSLVRVVAERTGRFYGQKMTAGDIYTVAGTAAPTRTANGGRATRTWLGETIGTVRPDRAGNLVVADVGSRPGDPGQLAPSVRVVAVRTGRFYGQKMTAGHSYRIAGSGKFGDSGDGGLATRAALSCADAVSLDRAGNVIVADCGRVRVVAARTGRFYGRKMTAGHIYSLAGTGTPGYSGDRGRAGRADVDATWVTVDNAGNVVIDGGFFSGSAGPVGLSRVRAVAARTGRFYGRAMRAGDIYTIAGNGQLYSGDGRPPTRAEVQPQAVAEDHAGNLVIGDCTSNQVRFVPAASGTFFGRKMAKAKIYTIAAGLCSFAVAADAGGNVLVADGRRVRVIAARSGTFYGQPMIAGRLYTISGDIGAEGVAVDSTGNVLAADYIGDLVWLVPAASGTFYGQPMTAGHSYVIAGNGNDGFGGDGGPGTAAELASPAGVAIDHAGNALIADSRNGRVRVVAATSGTFYGQPMTEGDIYTIAGNGRGPLGDGGPAIDAAVNPVAVAVDRAGNVLIADYGYRVRVVAATSGTFYGQRMTADDIYTIAGNGQSGFTGDGGPATRAELGFIQPSGVAAGRAGNVLIADDLRVRSVSG